MVCAHPLGYSWLLCVILQLHSFQPSVFGPSTSPGVDIPSLTIVLETGHYTLFISQASIRRVYRVCRWKRPQEIDLEFRVELQYCSLHLHTSF